MKHGIPVSVHVDFIMQEDTKKYYLRISSEEVEHIQGAHEYLLAQGFKSDPYTYDYILPLYSRAVHNSLLRQKQAKALKYSDKFLNNNSFKRARSWLSTLWKKIKDLTK